MIPQNIFEGWLQNKGLKKRSIKNYLYYFNRFRYKRFNQANVSRFLSDPSHRNTIARSMLLNLKECMIRNHKELEIDSYYYKEINDVFLPKITGRQTQKLINPLTKDQIDLLEKTFDSEQLKIMLLTCYHAGLRLQELINIKVNSFNWNHWKKNTAGMGEVKVFGKGHKEGIALLPSPLMVRISKFIRVSSDNYKGVDSKLFFIGASSFQKQLHAAGLKSGITQKNEDGKIIEETRVHPHKLRHSYAHNLLINGVDIRYIKEALRHSSIQSTQIYTKLNTQELKEKRQSVNS
jgi:site-specific recombinase XerD